MIIAANVAVLTEIIEAVDGREAIDNCSAVEFGCENRRMAFVNDALPGVLSKACLERGRQHNNKQLGLMPGLRPHIPLAAHTTEQKTRSIYNMLQMLLHFLFFQC